MKRRRKGGEYYCKREWGKNTTKGRNAKGQNTATEREKKISKKISKGSKVK